jgi:hypothetical protein
MDDTTWISYSKQSLQEILNEAREFYKANDSQVNSLKSVLLNINSSEEQKDDFVEAGLNKEVVQKLKTMNSPGF